MRKYVLKEYGSWGVMVLSYLAGLSGWSGVWPKGLLALLAISLLINSKQALTLWLRGRGAGRTGPMSVFMLQAVSGSLLLLYLLGGSLQLFLPYAFLPAAYVLLLVFAGEHALLTEISGFSLLALSTLMARFATSGEVDFRLYLAVAVFFIAGVFKVRVQFKKRMLYRVLSVVYLAAAVVIYHLIEMPFILLIPLLDNLVFAMTLYRATLQATGWIEVAKGVVFIGILKMYYLPLY